MEIKKSFPKFAKKLRIMFYKDSKRLKNIELAIRHLQCCCSSSGSGGIQSIVAGDNISIDNTDPSNPIISVSGIVMPEQYFVEITEGGRTGYGLKYRKDNPDNYGNIGEGSVDFTIQTSSSSSNGVTGDYTLAIGNNTQAPWGYSIVSNATTTASRNNGYYNLIVSSFGTVYHNNIWSSLLLGQNNVIGIEGASLSTSAIFGTTVNATGSEIRAGSGSAYFGAGLVGGSSATLVVGTSNEDLTINQGGNNPNRFNVPNPRFIVGNGTYNPSNNTVGTRSNAFYVMSSGEIGMPSYGDGTFTGTATKLLAVDADGKVIEEDLPSGTSLTVTDDDSVSVSNVETINFVGATVTDNLDGSVDVEYSGGTPGGADTQLQFNNDGEFGGISTITTDGTGLAITTNDTSTTPRFSITNNGTGDASMSFKAGTPTYTMGVDNSASDKFVISRSGALGTSNVLELDATGIPFVIDNTGAGFTTAANWYSKISSFGFKAQSSNTVYSEITINNGFITQSSVGNQISLNPQGQIKSTVGTSTDITLELNNGARGEFFLPDLGNATTKDAIVTQSTQTVKQAKVTINSLDFRNISSNPIEIVSAQGAGTVINIVGATAFLNYNSSPFNFTDEIFLRVGNNPSWSMDNADINAVVDNYISFKAPTQGSSSVGNSPVVITSSANSLGGDSNVTIIVTYTVDDYN